MTKPFHSTRGLAPDADLRTVALTGLASDGGLYLPKSWSQFSPVDLTAMRGMSYQEIAFRVLQPFTQGAIPDVDLRELIAKAYASFTDPAVVPLRQLDRDFHMLELFHGPTLAFKDVALQFLGQVFDYFMCGSGRRMTVIGATSGDTGSAAISALAGRDNIDVFILYPAKGPSEIQRRQMTCVEADNVHALAVDGTFDDCQAIVKDLFADDVLRNDWNLTTVNSINLLRILAQMPYYFFAALSLDAAPVFVVPTGNFGDVFAGYAAMRCGLPVRKLVVASNRNDILCRFFSSGRMVPCEVQQSLSPSMDIQVSSNFERLLFDLCGQDAAQVRVLMGELKVNKNFAVVPEVLRKALGSFAAGCASDEATLAAIENTHKNYDYVVDPHTAVGVQVASALDFGAGQPLVCLATAHPAKFPDTVKKAIGLTPVLPPQIAALITKPERTRLLPVDKRAVATYIYERKIS